MNIHDLDILDRHLIQVINGSDSLFWDYMMYTVTDTFSWSLVILALLIVIFRNNSWKETLVIFVVIGLLITVADQLCSGFTKPVVARWRPTQDPELMYLIDVGNGYRGGRFGFFSGHACNTFCMATFLALLFRSTNVTLVLYFWSLTTTYTRLYLGVHYLGDVIVGFIVGFILGSLFYVIYKQLSKRIGHNKLVSEQFTATGYLKSDLNAFLSVVFFNYICVIIVAMTRGF